VGGDEEVNKITVTFAPHIRESVTTRQIMLDVIIALCPAFILAVWVFGPRAALVVGVCVAACVLSEWVFQKALKRKNTIKDLSAAVTGMLLAFNLPATLPVWQAVFGSIIAVILVKQLFGGLGKNFANPAITARVVLFLAFSTEMTTWIVPGSVPLLLPPDIVTGATPLTAMMHGDLSHVPAVKDLFLGVHGGCLGETSELALLIGGLYLIARGVITWHAPVSFIAVVFGLTAALGASPVNHLFSGGLFLGAIFMATDYVTTPITRSGRAIFGLGAGLLTVIIRLYGSYPEGVSFAILFMNMLVPYINKLTAKKALGGLKQ
jgi:electron transport complex protein RnfD